MNRLCCYFTIVLCGAAVMAGWHARVRQARSFTGEFRYAQCVDHLNCGNCLLGWRDDVQCVTGKACIAFRVPGGFGGDFKACTPTGDADDWCNTGTAVPTIHTCNNGFYQWCACVDTGADCPSTVRCDCNWVMPTGPLPKFVINSVCY